MLLAYAQDNGKQELFRLTNFFPIPKALPSLIGNTDALILSGLIGFAGNDGKCYPKCKTLAESCGLNIRTVKYALNRLRELGMIATDRAHRRTSLTFKFLWNDIWVKCLKPGERAKATPGSEFNPYGMFSCFFIPKTIMASTELKPGTRVFLAYMMDRVGANGSAWPSYTEIAHDLKIGCRNTISDMLKELKEHGLLLTTKRAGSSASTTTNSYTLLFTNTLLSDIVSQGTKAAPASTDSAPVEYTSCTDTVFDVHHHNTTNENPGDKKETGRLTSSVLPSSHYNDLGAKPVVVLENKEEAVEAFVQSLPASPAKDKLLSYLEQIVSNIDATARLKMAIQLVLARGIKNKAAYLTSLIMRYRAGTYNIDGIEIMKNDFAQRARSENAQYFMHEDVREL